MGTIRPITQVLYLRWRAGYGGNGLPAVRVAIPRSPRLSVSISSHFTASCDQTGSKIYFTSLHEAHGRYDPRGDHLHRRLFNAIYMATCMQSATSDASIVAMTVLDISQTSAMLYGLHRRTNTLQLKLRLAVGSDSEGNDLLAMLCTLCRDVKKFKRQVRAGIQLRSCFPHKLDDDDQYILQNLRNNASNSKIISTDPTISVPRTYNMHGVAPNAQNLVAVDRRASTRASIQSLLHPAHPTILLETLEALFTIECILLTAYLEAAIPMFYCCYMLLLVNFPSAQYHTEMVGITLENVEERVVPLVLFGLFQLLSFRLLVRMIKRNCGMDAIKHLAFVLDKHMPLIQGKLTLWMAVTVCCRVVHFGASSAFFFC